MSNPIKHNDVVNGIRHLSPNQGELQYLNLEAITDALIDLNERWGLGSIKEIHWPSQTLTRSLDAPDLEFYFRYHFNTYLRNNKHHVTVFLYNRQKTVDVRVPGDSFPEEQKEQI